MKKSPNEYNVRAYLGELSGGGEREIDENKF